MKVTGDHEVAFNIALLINYVLKEIRGLPPQIDLSELPVRAGYASGYTYLIKEVVHQSDRDNSAPWIWRMLLPKENELVEYTQDPTLLAMSERFNTRAMFRISNGLLEVKFSATTETNTVIETLTLPSPRMSFCQALAYLGDTQGVVRCNDVKDEFYLTYTKHRRSGEERLVDHILSSYKALSPNVYSTPTPYEPQLSHLKSKFTIVPSNEIPKDQA
jgi:hypothetical protein